MNKKNVLIILILLLFTGCTPEYNLEFKDGRIYEKLTIKDIPNDYKEVDFKNIYAIPEKHQEYKKKFKNNKIEYSYDYSFKSILKSNFLKSCYSAHKLIEEEEYYIFQTSSNFQCYPLQINDFLIHEYKELTINIKIVDYKVLEHNADSIEGNLYTWKINKANYNNKKIFIKIKKNLSKLDVKDKKNNKFPLIYIIAIIGIVVILLIFIIIYALKLNKKRNKL